ncbi:hypothetical protein J6590_041316 [Homalodisca vitripennis]|nr:hypothetical protein J6590_041316 [Homalodisca vitripennis]
MRGFRPLIVNRRSPPDVRPPLDLWPAILGCSLPHGSAVDWRQNGFTNGTLIPSSSPSSGGFRKLHHQVQKVQKSVRKVMVTFFWDSKITLMIGQATL